MRPLDRNECVVAGGGNRPYAAMRDAELDRLLRDHGDWVRRIAWQVHGRMAASTELEDLIQVGLVALIEAARAYVDQGHAFQTYASVRVRGAMIDQLRRDALTSRRAMADRRRLAQARQHLEQRLLRPARPDEMAAELGLDAGAYRTLVDRAQNLESAGLDASYSDHDLHFADESAGADSLLADRQSVAILRDHLADMPEREAMILQLFFVEELNLHEIGAILGVGAARVCQIKKAALQKLRQQLSGYGGAEMVPLT